MSKKRTHRPHSMSKGTFVSLISDFVRTVPKTFSLVLGDLNRLLAGDGVDGISGFEIFSIAGCCRISCNVCWSIVLVTELVAAASNSSRLISLIYSSSLDSSRLSGKIITINSSPDYGKCIKHRCQQTQIKGAVPKLTHTTIGQLPLFLYWIYDVKH
ncbi:hypothetical protein KUTeg_022272 [Tegillarca granosa]|uniref:Uncharacterized protein n=1 Tax=Tegillarca granosa TaxID=220873 RepID=A0ABQ9E5R4_TEGGR|nr:hypothetical protein KUTeg_022272 [Tegillarca granosa]